MAYPIPKIQYDPGTGVVTLTMTWPPMQKSGMPDLEAKREDSISISGLKQSVFERIDEFLPLQFDFVPTADLVAWQSFLRFALAGGLFNYFPDATIAHFTTYTLEDAKIAPKRAYRGYAKFSLRLRKVVGSDQTGS